MPDAPARSSTRLDPRPAWTVVTDAPLRGLSLAREVGLLLAWDEADGVSLFDLRGDHVASARAPGRVVAGAISDTGSLVALLGDGGRLWLLDAGLELAQDRSAPPDASTLAVDPHGRYLAVASRLSQTHLYTRHGKPAGRFETRQALAHLAFLASRPLLLGAAAHGTLAGIELDPRGSGGKLDPEVDWQESLLSNVGRLAASGDGGMLLAACFAHGVQRYDLRGRNEGAYHLGGSASHAVPDFVGRTIAVATLEGELAVLSPAGNVRWRSNLPRPALALEVDALGRFLIYGLATGEITLLDLQGGGGDRPRAGASTAARAGAEPRAAAGGPVRAPAWTVEAVATDEQAEFAVLAVLDDPPRLALIPPNNRLQIYATDGRPLGQAPEIAGVGRILRTAPGWIAASTDRHAVLCDVRRNLARRLDLSLVEVTHLAIRPDDFGLAFVQERDRIGRATAAGRWTWRRELRQPVEDLAIGPDGYFAVTTDDGQLLVFDGSGEPAGSYASDPAEPLALLEAPAEAPEGVAWLTLARRSQVLRGHGLRGRPLWQAPVPFEAWQFQRVGALAAAVAPDGRLVAYDGSGQARAQGRPSESPQAALVPGPGGEVVRVARSGVHLICTDLAGRVRWRAISEAPIGPFAAAGAGVAALLGRRLAWFPSSPTVGA